MAERMRRLRACLANTHPGALGDTARPNYVGPSGQPGWFGRMNAGESPRNQGRCVGAPLSVWRRRSQGLRKNAAVERREVNAQRYWACAARRRTVTRAFRRSAPLTFGDGSFPPHERGG